ncbi:MAG: T9SS type A sorting domain-containing protein [Ignavibacteriaceae bacterium]|nr:T9SS type A sorting domain-containing protein [Ignavibacteriaceae bacterium]
MSSTGDLYFLFDEIILKSTNNGDNWTDVSAGVSGYKFSIAEHPNGYIYAGTNQGVYRSTNAGSSWTPETSGLNDGALSIAIHPDGSIFAGGYVSAHRSDDLGLNWNPFTEGAQNCEFSDLAFGKSDVLFAAIENLGVYRTTSPITSVEDNRSTSLSDYSLQQNYPNPFNPSTSIQYSIGSSQFVTLKVFDVLGKEVATLVNEEKPAGSHQVTFDARELASGIYLYRLSANSFTETKKLILIK